MNANEANNSNSSKKIIEREQIDESIIWLIGVEEGWFAAIGDKRITEIYKNKEELEELINKKDWNLITAMLTIMAEGVSRELEASIWKKIDEKLFAK